MSVTNARTTWDHISLRDQRNVPITEAAKQAIPESLLEKADLNDIVKYMAQEWGMIVAAWIVLAVSPSWFYPIGVLVICGRFHALGVLLHDACHLKRSESIHAILVDWMGGYPIGLSIEGMRYHHLRHHRHTCSSLDPYLKTSVENSKIMRWLNYLRGIVVILAWIIRPYFGLFARIFPNLKNVYAKLFFGDRAKEDLRDSKQIDLCLRRDIGQIIYQTILIGLIIVYPNWMVLYYIIPLALASVVNSYRVVEEHMHVIIDDHSPVNIAQYTKDQPMDLFSRFILFPRNIGYHRMHHLHPAVRYEKLPELQRWYGDYAKNAVSN